MVEEAKAVKISQKAVASFQILSGNLTPATPWIPENVDKLEKIKDNTDWCKIVERCRYFYKRDPFASTVINKIVDISVNDLTLREKSSRKSLKTIFNATKPAVLAFLRNAALEYLISGLVIPEVEFAMADKTELERLGIKRFEELLLPSSMWLRDPTLMKIKSPLIGGKVSYFMKIPEEVKIFILNEGKYGDGTEDKELYAKLVKEMPEFIAAVKAGKLEVLLDNPLVLRYRTITGSPYPIPYLMSSIESLEHKRNLRRMDYSIASRVITAILLVKLGSDEFPLTEDNEDQLEKLKQEMLWRESKTQRDVEKVFQLFGNHTLTVEWVFPEVSALLDEAKYKNINSDIAVGLGFPRIMVTGETEKSFTSDPDIATVSPLHTMRRIQEALIPIASEIFEVIAKENGFSGDITVKFRPINMMSVTTFVQGLASVYSSGNLSREEYTAAFGYDFYEEMDKRVVENEKLKELDLEEFAPVPFSPKPGEDVAPVKKTKPAPSKENK
jgi:hypothetical protein